MALREKVAIAILTIIVFQISSKYCMPRSLKIPCKSLKTRKYSPTNKYAMLKEQSAPVIPICQAFKFPETEYPKPPRAYLQPSCTKYKATETLNKKSNAMCKCPKSSKILHILKEEKKKQNSNTTRLLEPNKPATLPCGFNGRFPEVEYPLSIAETWSPKYWTQLHNPEMKQCSTPICNQDTENIIKATNSAIEKAVHVLLRSQQTSSLLTETCPLNSQAESEFLTSAQDNVTNITSTSIVPQGSVVQDLEKKSSNNDKPANTNATKSKEQEPAVIDELPNETKMLSFGGSDAKIKNDLPVIITDATKLAPSAESILSNEPSNEAPGGTNLSLVEEQVCPSIPTDKNEHVILPNDSLSTLKSTENIIDSPITPVLPGLDHSDGDLGIPERRDPNADSTVSDSYILKSDNGLDLSILDENSSLQHHVDEAATETTIPNALEFIAPVKSPNSVKDNFPQDLSVPDTNNLPLISGTPNNDKSIISEVDSKPFIIPNEPIQERSDLPLQSVKTVPDVTDSSVDSKTLASNDSSIDSVLHSNDSHTCLEYPITVIPDELSESAGATLPDITCIPLQSINQSIPHTSLDEPSTLNKDDGHLDTTKINTDDFPAISHADIASDNISIPSTTEENARKPSSISNNSANVASNIMEIQEYDYTTVSPFYNDLEIDSLNTHPVREQQTWILDPNDKEYLIVW